MAGIVESEVKAVFAQPSFHYNRFVPGLQLCPLRPVLREASDTWEFSPTLAFSEPLCPSSSNLYLPCPDSSFSVLGQVGSNAGIVGMTKEHLGLALALNVPVFVVVTKIDMCPANILQGK